MKGKLLSSVHWPDRSVDHAMPNTAIGVENVIDEILSLRKAVHSPGISRYTGSRSAP